MDRTKTAAVLLTLSAEQARDIAPDVVAASPLAPEPDPTDPPAHLPNREVLPSLWDWAAAQAERRQLAARYTPQHVVQAMGHLRVRYAQGIAKYGTPLRCHNGRRPLNDALQEAVDLLAYLHQADQEIRDAHCREIALDALLDQALDMVVRLALLCDADPFGHQLADLRQAPESRRDPG